MYEANISHIHVGQDLMLQQDNLAPIHSVTSYGVSGNSLDWFCMQVIWLSSSVLL